MKKKKTKIKKRNNRLLLILSSMCSQLCKHLSIHLFTNEQIKRLPSKKLFTRNIANNYCLYWLTRTTIHAYFQHKIFEWWWYDFWVYFSRWTKHFCPKHVHSSPFLAKMIFEWQLKFGNLIMHVAKVLFWKKIAILNRLLVIGFQFNLVYFF